MTTRATAGKIVVTQGRRHLFLAASVMTCLLVAMGGIVCATESGAGCPDWPGCYGRIVPPLQIKPIIEYMHRFVAALTSPLIVAAAVVGWRNYRAARWISRPPMIAIVFVIAVIIFGAFAVLTGLPPAVAAVDLGSALTVLTLMLTATVAVFIRQQHPDGPDRFATGGGFVRLNLAALGAVFAVYVSGVLVAGPGSLTRCVGWPLWTLVPGDRPGWPQGVRLAVALLAAVLVAAVVVEAWRTPRRAAAYTPAARRAAAWLAVAFVAEMLVGGLILLLGATDALLVLRIAAAVLVWALLVVSAALAGLAPAGQPLPASIHTKLAATTAKR